MSTRRARIKAVTSLPPRRKIAENAENKIKQVTNKEADQSKCAITPRSLAKLDSGSDKSPAGKIESLKIKSPEKALEIDKPQTPVNKSSCKYSEKTPVYTAACNSRPVFVSPQVKNSPRKKPVPSPVTTTKSAENALKSSVVLSEKIQLAEFINETIDKNVLENRNDVPDDYNVPSVPESVSEDGMDGIIPLQPTCSAPKPLHLLKNEIISEKVEVLFDPIVPLPSPSKVRPKLRPVPRLAPHRRNSVQGSASESEDESRRALLSSGSTTVVLQRQRHDSHTSQSTVHSVPNRETIRIRNDSMCSNVSQATVAPLHYTSPVKEKQYTKSRRQEISRRMAALRRKRETIKRDNLTMYDLIFYNPVSNPIVPDQDELDAKEANEKETANRSLGQDNAELTLVEETAAPVPQIKLGPNGEIVLDEQSLVINQSASNRKVSSVVREGSWGGSGNRYRRSSRTAEWSDAETVRFYRALARIGTDFTLMEPLFPGRTRRDLKLKFKKEEKCNIGQVDKALRTQIEWDATQLHDEFKSEREEAAKRIRDAKQAIDLESRKHHERKIAAKQLRIKESKSTGILGKSILPGNFLSNYNKSEIITADEVIRRAREKKSKKRLKTNWEEPNPVVPPIQQTSQQNGSPPLATLTLIQNNAVSQQKRTAISETETATLSKLTEQDNLNPVSAAPGSLVVLTVDDPNSPSKKMLQTYVAHAEGVLTPVALPPSLLSSVVGYMKRGGTPKSNVSARSSPLLMSPSSVASHESRMCVTPSIIQVNPSPIKRQRHSSYTITQL